MKPVLPPSRPLVGCDHTQRSHIWSRSINGTKFVGAEREIQEVLGRLNEAKITD